MKVHELYTATVFPGFDKSRSDYDPDLDFPPLIERNRPETINLGPTRGNSIRAQLEELWARKGVVYIAHVTCWEEKNGRITGAKRGKLLWRVKVPKIRKRKCSQPSLL